MATDGYYLLGLARPQDLIRASLILLVTWTTIGHAGVPNQATLPDVAFIERFLTTLEGTWDGAAVVTPVGPRPYDITFQRTPSGEVTGAAYPGAATHYWTFFRRGQTLGLRFLSTFRGNRQPIQLEAKRLEDESIVFRADHPDYLEVHIERGSPTIFVRVFLRHRPHVEIHLNQVAVPSGSARISD